MIHPRSFRALIREIGEKCEAVDQLRVVAWKERPSHSASVHFGFRRSDGSWDFCLLDIRSGIHKNRTLLFDGSQLSRTNTLWDARLGLRRLNDDLESAILLLRNAIDGRRPSARHDRVLRARRSDNTRLAVQRLGFDDIALESGRVVRIRRAQLGRLIRYYLRSAYGRLRRPSSGLNIVLYGPDGCGKTTQALHLAKFLRAAGVRSSLIQTYHAFVEMEELPAYTAGRTSILGRKAYRRAHNRLAQQSLLTASYLRRLWAYATRLRPRIKRHILMIHDRYLFDVFLKFFKLHGRNYPFLTAALSRLAPKADVLFVLRADPEEIHARNTELSPEEIVATYHL